MWSWQGFREFIKRRMFVPYIYANEHYTLVVTPVDAFNVPIGRNELLNWLTAIIVVAISGLALLVLKKRRS